MPRTFRFNHILSVDLIKIELNGVSPPFLNCVDHGSNLQVVAAVKEVQRWSREHAKSWLDLCNRDMEGYFNPAPMPHTFMIAFLTSHGYAAREPSLRIQGVAPGTQKASPRDVG